MDYENIKNHLNVMSARIHHELCQADEYRDNWSTQEALYLLKLERREERINNLINKIIEREDKKSIAYYEDVASHGMQEDEDDYVESEDPHIPNIHEDQWS